MKKTNQITTINTTDTTNTTNTNNTKGEITMKNTRTKKLNVCQGYQVVKKLQDIERARAACKKELQRVSALRNNVRKACQESVSFEYEDYKNRQIDDVRTFIFAD